MSVNTFRVVNGDELRVLGLAMARVRTLIVDGAPVTESLNRLKLCALIVSNA